MPPITAQDVFMFISILAVLLAVIALYHLLFILVDIRKITRRFEDVTQQVEALILKPISMTDQLLEWVLEQVNQHKAKKHHHEVKKED